MRLIKPFCASVLTRPFELRRKQYLGVSVLLFSPMGSEVRLLPEKELWPFWATQPESAGPLEEGFPRRHGEYLVCASAWTTPERRDAVPVRAQVGTLRKDLVVWGPRQWRGSDATPAADFESLRLGWDKAYGGPDFAANPLGMGRAEVDDGQGRRVRPVPHIEYPKHPALSPRDEGVPAGLGPIDQMWPQRAALRGTYDERWLKEDFPGLAPDIDLRFFNLAPADQQQDRSFAGDEPYAFHNLHPRQPVVSGRLPGLSARVLVGRRGRQGQLEGVRTRLTALWFFPGEERVIQIFQGALEIEEDDASDIELMLAAVERTGQEQTDAHYAAVRDKRLDRKNGALEVLRESDLVPADIATPLHDFTPSPNRGLDRAQRRAERDREAARAKVVAHGLDPDEHAPPVKAPPQPPIRSIDDLIAARERMEREAAEAPERAAAEKAKATAGIRAIFERESLDYSQIEAETSGQMTSGPPKPMAPAMTERFRHMIADPDISRGDVSELHDMLADPKIQAQWQGGDAAQLDAYRQTAQHQVPARSLSLEESAPVRERVRAAHAAGTSMAGWDLTGADLSRLDLPGADLKAALLEGANLSHCNLRGAQLEAATLVRCRIGSSCLDAARLARSNLSAAVVDNTTMKGADLRGAILEGTRLSTVDLSQAVLDEARLHEVQCDSVDLSGARSDSLLVFRSLNLSKVRFAEADFKQVVFVECDLRGANFSGARLGKVAFVTVKADGTRFKGMVVGVGCFAAGCTLTKADLRGVTLERVSLRATVAAGADFRGAKLRSSDLSECDLRGALFHGADAREARFVRAHLDGASLASANLAGAVLQHAWLQDTDFRHANLHESDMARVRIGTGVRFDHSLRTRMRTLPRRAAPPAA
jgi:uncharacterized protein YjbI with pentapeptide repeats